MNTENYSILNGNVNEMKPEPSAGFLKKKIPEKWIKPIIIVGAVVIAFIVVFVVMGIIFENRYQEQILEEEKKAYKEGAGSFTAEEDEAELVEGDISSLITQAYYTNDGSLAVWFSFKNGMDTVQHLVSVEVEIRNEKNEVIAKGYSSDIDANFRIPVGGTSDLCLYIPKEFVRIEDDSLSVISYDVTTNCEEIE